MTQKSCYWVRPPGPVAHGLKIGLLGGSFNPAHEGHVHISELARKRLGLDYVWWLVAPRNPLKPRVGLAPLYRRVDWARFQAASCPRIVVMDIEWILGTRYTIDTLRKLKCRFRDVHFVWLMGSDNLDNFHHWRRWPDIVASVPIAVVARPGSVLSMLHTKPALRFSNARKSSLRDFATAAPPALVFLDGPRNPVSSTEIRAARRRNEVFVQLIPA